MIETAASRQQRWSFFESPHGLEFLHRLVTAIHLVLGQSSDGGIRNICWLLELCQLDPFIATSYGAQQKIAVSIEQTIEVFGQEERARLALQMPKRKITLCEDETFHPQICLVAIEPVSNFLILEAYAAKRDAPTWNTAVNEALKPFSVDVIQCVSDQATALIAHAESSLGVHHSPDLFHVQQEASRATSGPLYRQKQKAEKPLQAAVTALQTNIAKFEHFQGNWPNTIEQLEQEKKLVEERPALELAVHQAREAFELAQGKQTRARSARVGIGQAYHPFDLQTGAPVAAAEVEARLMIHFDTLDQVALDAGLSESAKARLAKAKRVLPSMVATIAFFWRMIADRVALLEHSPETIRIWLNNLLPGCYLAAVAERCRDPEERKRLRELSKSLIGTANARDGPLKDLSDAEVSQLETHARLASELFQRSSSCVEGRNGQLSLRHHGLRTISPRKLRVLGVLHNYVIKRRDGTTAAKRFFGQEHRDLFAFLLERVGLPPRPRERTQSK